MVNEYVGTIFSNPLAVQAIFPFLLIFVLVFAILQKSEILGKGKKQIDALIALVMGLIVISFGYAVYIINNLIPFLAVALVIILVFMLLLGSFFKSGEFNIPGWLKVVFGIIIFIALTITVLVLTGAWDYLSTKFVGDSGGSILANVIFIVLIIAVGAAFWFGGDSSSEKK